MRPRADAPQRTNVHDPAAAYFFHLSRALLAAEESCLQVYVVNEIPVLFRDGERIETRESRSIVYQTIQRPEPFADLTEQAPDLVHI